jgi:hypothetical protein
MSELILPQSVVQLLRSRCQVWALTLHNDNAFFGINLYDRETICLQLTLQTSPHHTATYRSERAFVAFLFVLYCVSPTEVELPLRLVLCECKANFLSAPSSKLAIASKRIYPDVFVCFQSIHTTSTKDMRLTSYVCERVREWESEKTAPAIYRKTGWRLKSENRIFRPLLWFRETGVHYPPRNRTKIVLNIHNIDSCGDGWCDDCLDRMSGMTDNGIHVLIVIHQFQSEVYTELA